MFQNLQDRFKKTFDKLTSRGVLTEAQVVKSLKEVRVALIEADVALPVVKQIIAKIRRRSLGKEVMRSVSPAQQMIKIVQDELTEIMGEESESLDLKAQPPVVIVLAGLQGAGKTTTCAKLAKWLMEREKKQVMMVSTDVYRPAAMDQLAVLAEEIDSKLYPATPKDKPLKIVKDALKEAKKQVVDVLLIDTAGRMHIDSEMMDEISDICKESAAHEILFVVDSMTGQDAANTAKAFNEKLKLTGVILTKTDGDARGGAALSVRHITGAPIKFMGAGEKIEALEAFHPDRVASRILGMGDVSSFVEEVTQKLDKQEADKLAKKLKRGRSFNMNDFLKQLEQMSKLGGVGKLMSKLPGTGGMADAIKNQDTDGKIKGIKSMIQSMTKKERLHPDIIKGSRRKRIALGSGNELVEVNRMLKQFTMMQKMMKKVGKKGAGGMMNQMKNMMPPGGGFPQE
jgi:signal recognition particle subunit SRP54